MEKQRERITPQLIAEATAKERDERMRLYMATMIDTIMDTVTYDRVRAVMVHLEMLADQNKYVSIPFDDYPPELHMRGDERHWVLHAVSPKHGRSPLQYLNTLVDPLHYVWSIELCLHTGSGNETCSLTLRERGWFERATERDYWTEVKSEVVSWFR
jgi:hypothetical protein